MSANKYPQHFSHVTERVSKVEEIAKAMVTTEHIEEEKRTTHAITGDILRLHQALKPRWEAFQAYQLWESCGCSGDEPTITDEVTREVRSAAYALAPCQVVNDSLNEFVGLTLKTYDNAKFKRVMHMVEANKQVAEAVKDLRQIAIHAEEAMEQEALGLIFKAVENNPDYKEQIEAIVREKLNIDSSETLLDTVEVRTALLEALVVDFPKQCQEKEPEAYKGLVFKYFDNYPPLVAAELSLLTTPFMLQNSDAPYHYDSLDELIEANPVIEAAIEKIRATADSELAAEAAVRHFINDYPEIFGVQDLSNKVVTFVGAGFPLTGLLLHIQTEGAAINLIDYDETAVRTARDLLKTTETLGITNPKACEVIHADARDIQYVSRGDKAIDGCPLHEVTYIGKKKFQVTTDVLDLASALPRDVTNQVMQENAKNVPIVRKRNVSGISTLLYEQFTLPEESIFRLAGSVTPPQKVLSGASPAPRVTGLMDVINVNSDDLYVNTSRFEAKKAQLEQLLPSSSVHAGGGIKWNARNLEIPGSIPSVKKQNDVSLDVLKGAISAPHVVSGGSVQWNARTLSYYQQH